MQLDVPLEIAVVLEGLVAQPARIDSLALAVHHRVVSSIKGRHFQWSRLCKKENISSFQQGLLSIKLVGLDLRREVTSARKGQGRRRNT